MSACRMVKYLTLVVLRYSCKISDFVHFCSSSHHHTNAGFYLAKIHVDQCHDGFSHEIPFVSMYCPFGIILFERLK